MRRRRSRWFWIAVPLLFAAAAAAVALVVARVGLRARVESDPIDMPDDELGYRLRPGLDGARLVVPGRPVPPSMQLSFDVRVRGKGAVAKLREFEVRTNQLGFRGPEVAAAAPDGVVRIVCAGDSITFGWGVAEPDAYPWVMAAELRRRLGGGAPGVEVVDTGVPGYKLDVVVRQLERDVVPLAPDVVTVCKLGDLQAALPLDTFREALAEVAALGRRHGFAVAFLCPPRSTFDRFALTRWFRDAMEQEAAAQGVLFVDFMSLVEQAQADRGVEVDVEGSVQRLVRRGPGGARTVVVEADYLQGADGEDPLAPALYAAMDDPDLSEALMFDDGHPDEEGHRLMGEYLAARLIEAGILGADAGEGGAEPPATR